MSSTVVVVAALSILPWASAPAQVKVQPGGAAGSILFDPSGNLLVDGHCFGNVNPLPGSNVIPSFPAIKVFGGLAVAGSGNLYFSGPVNFGSSTFAGGIVIRASGAPVASFSSSDGSLHAAGQCSSTSGNSNTKWYPGPWEANFSNNNCYTYAVDMNFQDPQSVDRSPGFSTVGECCNLMEVHSDPNGFDIGLVERAEKDGLVAVGPIYPDTPTLPLGGNAYPCTENHGHLVFMIGLPAGGNPNVLDDYHFLRFDQENGSWSYKDGFGGHVFNTDINGNRILNPLLFNTGISLQRNYDFYVINVGFFCAPGGHAKIYTDPHP